MNKYIKNSGCPIIIIIKVYNHNLSKCAFLNTLRLNLWEPSDVQSSATGVDPRDGLNPSIAGLTFTHLQATGRPENPHTHTHGQNMQTPHRNRPGASRFRPRSFLLWGDSANHEGNKSFCSGRWSFGLHFGPLRALSPYTPSLNCPKQ